MNYFFLTGLPRSGTAWMANYLSYGSVMCLHDAVGRFSTPKAMKAHFDESGAYAAGNSDPANLMLYKEIKKTFPGAKWVLITRPAKDVEESCKKLNMPVAQLGEALKQIPEDAMKVSFSKLFDKADEIGKFIYPEWESPPWRLDMLKKTNVQLHFGKVSDQFHIPDYLLKGITAPTPNMIAYQEALDEVCSQDPTILRYLEQLRWITELYYKIITKKPIDIELAKNAIEAVVLEWPLNPFLRAQAVTLTSAIANCLSRYNEAKPIHSCPVETEVPGVVSFLLGGMTKVNQDMPKLRELAKKIYQDKLRQEGN